MYKILKAKNEHRGKVFRGETRHRAATVVLLLSFAWSSPFFAQEMPMPIGSSDSEPLPPSIDSSTDSKQLQRQMAEMVLPRLLKGEISVEDAWRKQALTPEGIVYLLNEKMHHWGGFGWDMNVPVRHALCKMLVEHASTQYGDFVDSAKASIKVRVWVGDYLQSVKDERAVAVLEKVASSYPANQSAKASDPVAFQALERLAWYYMATNQQQLAMKTYLRMTDVYEPAYNEVAYSVLMAARLARTLGDEQQAKTLYARVFPYGYGLATGAALRDQAEKLLEANKPEEAIRVLTSEPLVGEGAKQAQAAVTAFLAVCHYRAGRAEIAKQKALEAQRIFDALSKDEKGFSGIAEQVQFAQACIVWSEKWKNGPIQVLPGQISVTRAQLDEAQRTKQPVVIRLSARTQRQLPLQLSIRSPKPSTTTKPTAATPNTPSASNETAVKPIRARLTSGDWTGQRHFYFEQEITVEISANALLAQQNSVAPHLTSTPTTPQPTRASGNNTANNSVAPRLVIWVEASVVSESSPANGAKRHEVEIPIVVAGS